MMLLAPIAHFGAFGKTVTLNNGVEMPTINLGTCCGSKPSVGLEPWLDSGGVGIDTAFDYQDQTDIKTIIATRPRTSYFVTTKLPAGFGNSSDCDADASIPTRYVAENLKELGLTYVDLVLLHAPCKFKHPFDGAKRDLALWSGMQTVLAANLTRSIGVSNYDTKDLTAIASVGVKPAVNQCVRPLPHPSILATHASSQPVRVATASPLYPCHSCQQSTSACDHCLAPLSLPRLPPSSPRLIHLRFSSRIGRCRMTIKSHDDATIAYCKANGIVYEGYDVMKGCPFTDSTVTTIATAHNVSAAQVCLRWMLEKEVIMATGTGADPQTAAQYAKEDLDIYDFKLSAEEIAQLDNLA